MKLIASFVFLTKACPLFAADKSNAETSCFYLTQMIPF